jgi:hypothetical protein
MPQGLENQEVAARLRVAKGTVGKCAIVLSSIAWMGCMTSLDPGLLVRSAMRGLRLLS